MPGALPSRRHRGGLGNTAPGEARREEGEVEGKVRDLPPLTSQNEVKCSGGETRTLNLADPQEGSEYQHRLE